jgi:hypothetical protein
MIKQLSNVIEVEVEHLHKFVCHLSVPKQLNNAKFL